MLIKKFLIILILSGLFSKNLWAATDHEKHGDDHPKIFHAFTLEGDIGKAQDGSAKNADLSGWIGSDYNRLWIRSEKRSYGNYEEIFEAQALYSRNFSRFWDAQIGIVHDFSTDFTKTNVNYLTIGLEGLAPQLFETTAQFFLSDEGNYSARLKQEVDIFITQKLITQPYFETEFFTQDVIELETKSGLSDLELGIVTRYEITRKFAPYFAARYHTKTFGTAKLAKELGEMVSNFSASLGVRLRF